MLRFDERVHLPKNRENTITFLVNGEPIGTVETLAPGAKTVDIPIPPIDYDSVTDALGYVPYNSSNPDGYITSSALTNYVTTNTNQTITAGKSFHNAELLTDNFITLNGTTAYLRGQSGINYYNLMNLNSSGITVGSANQPIKIVGESTNLTINSSGASFSNLLGSFKINNMDILTNEATATNSLGIGYTTVNSSYIDSINIGNSAQVTATNCLAIGNYASAEQVGAIAIYSSENSAHRARANGYGSIAIGRNALAINANYNIAIGDYAIAQNTNSIQLGNGNNATSNSLQVMSYKLLDTSTGLIPDARLSSNIARLTDIPAVTVDQVYDGTSANAQSGIAIANAGFLTGITSSDVINGLGYTPVDKAGDTMTGNLTIENNIILKQNSSRFINTQRMDVVKGTAPDSTIYSGVFFCDSHGIETTDRLGGLETRYTSGGQTRIDVLVYEPTNGSTTSARLSVGYDANGNAYSYFPDTECVDSQWINSSVDLASNVSMGASVSKSYSLSSYLPSDGAIYNVKFSIEGETGNSSGDGLEYRVHSDVLTSSTRGGVIAGRTRTNSTMLYTSSFILPIGPERKIYIDNSNSSSSSTLVYLRAQGYRRVGTNA